MHGNVWALTVLQDKEARPALLTSIFLTSGASITVWNPL